MNAKPHKFVALDGMRGLAALAVALFHRRYWFGGEDFFGHAYLAVDFFFLLSGFVIAHAYEDRLRRHRGVRGFLRDRVIRLHPMLVLAGVVGSVAFLLQLHAGRVERPALLPLSLLASFVPIPAFWNTNVFPTNLPLWSLFWEIVANILFALVAARLTTRRLVVLVVVTVAIMLVCDVRLGGFGVGDDGATLPFGLPRVCSSFFLGVLLLRVHRSGRFPVLGMGWLPPLLLCASFVLLGRLSPWSVVYDPVAALLLYPCLLLWVAGSKPAFPALAEFSGALSYPLYLLHDPVLKLLTATLVFAHVSRQNPQWPLIGLLHYPVMVLISYLALRLFDEPVRAWLRARFGSSGHKTPVPTPHAAVSDRV